MVERIYVDFKEVRALGNVLEEKEASDYTTSDCSLTESTDTVNNRERTIFTLTIDNGGS